MGKYLVKRLLWMIPVLIGVAVLVFVIMYFVPGDPASLILGSDATVAELEAKREQLGLNDPFIVQLLRYLKNIFLRFDLANPIARARPSPGRSGSACPARLLSASSPC